MEPLVGGGNGDNGGSGGGAPNCDVARSYGTGIGVGTSVRGDLYKGNNGGGQVTTGGLGSGGGGGADAVGQNGTTSKSGDGGNGVVNGISGASVTYAAGGAGSATFQGATSGTGGSSSLGGDGGLTGGNGVVNTGSGGGGSKNAVAGGNGGSGIVIVRYLTYGTLYLGSTNTSSQDLAEYYVSGDKTIEAGDVVTISNQEVRIRNQGGTEETATTKGVLRKAEKTYDSKLIGIISTNPGVLMGSIDGENKEDKRMLALAGRVPVKIDPDSPAIKIGDFLTSSDKPGLAKKATRPGYIVARALEAWKPGGSDRIEAFISLSYYMGDIDPWGNFRTLEVDTLKVNKTLEVGGVNILDRITKQQEEIDALKASIRKLEETQH